MRTLTLTLLALLTLLAAGTTRAQDAPQPPSIFMTSWVCNQGALDTLFTISGERSMPVWQELVDEGMIQSYFVLGHAWGDESNYVTMMLADDVPSGVAANEEFGRRMQAAGDNGGAFLEACTTHVDEIYTGSFLTQNTSGMTPEPPYAMAFGYFACPFNKLGEITQDARENYLPAAQASVDAGKGYFAGGMVHDWAGKWTFVLVRGAKDVPGLLEFSSDTGSRIESDGPGPTQSCTSHKDNFYRVVHATQPRSE